MKKTRLALLVLLLLAFHAPVRAQSADGYDYSLNAGGNTITITGYDGSDGNVTIPATIDGLLVTGIASFSFYYHPGVTSVTIPDSVTSIGEYAFAVCLSLTNATIPNGLTSIEGWLFADCISLTTVVIPDSVTSIGTDAFASTALTSILIPDSVTSIGEGAFSSPYGQLSSVVIGNGVTNIADQAFSDCVSLATLTIGNSVTSIGSNAFYDCSSLVYVTIPSSVTDVGKNAFAGSYHLNSIYFQGNAPTADSSAFSFLAYDATAYYLPGTTGWADFSENTGLPTVELNSGSLKVNIAPADAISAGAQWQLNSGPDQNSGVTMTNLIPLSYIVSFTSISGWKTPSPQTVTITGGATNMITGNYILQESPFVKFNLLYTFTPLAYGYNSDGANPLGALILSGSTLYGTTEDGGINGNGTVFAVETNGEAFTNVYELDASCNCLADTNSDGAEPYAGVILSGNMLYGTADIGGSSQAGTVFSVSFNGADFETLYTFTNGGDGGYPVDSLILSGSALYGTAQGGGAWGNGTVFKISTNGTGFTNLYSFTEESTNFSGFYTNSDGAGPSSPLILSGNTLYGTAQGGGSSGAGTVFAIVTNGADFKVLHDFTGASDGSDPDAVLLLSGNTLYGTASQGGSLDNGIVFAVETNGTGFKVLHDFTGGSDGAFPNSVILYGGTLYGTTRYGGDGMDGTVFALNTNGQGFTTLYFFSATDTNGFNGDGANPFSGVVLSSNMVYGTAAYGGGSGNGTVFSLSLPEGPSVPAQPSIASVMLCGSILMLNGIAGQAGGTYFVLASTNLALPLSQWATVATNVLTASGNFAITVTPSGPQSFYILKTQ